MAQLPLIEVWNLDDGFIVVARLGDVEFRRGYSTRVAAYAAQELLMVDVAAAVSDADVGNVLVDWAVGGEEGKGC